MVDGVKKHKKGYNPKTWVFEENFDSDFHNEWIEEHSWEIYGAYFRCVRWWVKHRNFNNFQYVVFRFNDYIFNVYFHIEEMHDTFNYALGYFEVGEDYEMCAYIKHLADELGIKLKDNV